MVVELPPFPSVAAEPPDTPRKGYTDEEAAILAVQVERIDMTNKAWSRRSALADWETQVTALLDEAQYGSRRGRRGTLPPIALEGVEEEGSRADLELPKLMLHRTVHNNLDVFTSANIADLAPSDLQAFLHGELDFEIMSH